MVSSPTKDDALVLSPVPPSQTSSPGGKQVLQGRHYQHRLQQLDGTAFNDGEDSYAHRGSRNEPYPLPTNYHEANSAAPSTRENSRSNDQERTHDVSAHISSRSKELGCDENASKDIGFDRSSTNSGRGVDFAKDVFYFDGSTSGARDGNGSSAQISSLLQPQKPITDDHETNWDVLKADSIVPEITRIIRSPSIETDLYGASIQPRRSIQLIEERDRTAETDPFRDPYTASSADDATSISIPHESANNSTNNTDTATEALQKMSPASDHSTNTPYVFLSL